MKQGYFLLITLMFSMGLQAQTLKETIRGKFGEYQGTSETRVRGGKTTTVYRDKYGVVTGTSETKTNPLGKTTTIYRDKYGQKTGTSISRTKGHFHQPPLLFTRIDMDRKLEPAFIVILVTRVPSPIVTSMVRLLAEDR